MSTLILAALPVLIRPAVAALPAGPVMILPNSFIVGLIWGSFANVVIYRLKNGRNVIFGHSFCPECKTQLKWYDLIPILSFVWLRGHCRYCHKKISWQYPIVEILSGFIWVGVFYKFGVSLANIYYLFILSLFLVIAVYDFKWKIIPDKIVYPAIAVALVYNFNISSLITAAAAFSFFFLIFYFSNGRAMGFGDAKLAVLIALFFSPLAAFIAFDLAFILGGIYGIILLAIGKKSLRSQIAFGPFLVVGAITSFFMSDLILKFIVF